MRNAISLIAIAFIVAACGGTTTDNTPADSGPPVDMVDAGQPDSGPSADAGTPDAGSPDAGASDAGPELTLQGSYEGFATVGGAMYELSIQIAADMSFSGSVYQVGGGTSTTWSIGGTVSGTGALSGEATTQSSGAVRALTGQFTYDATDSTPGHHYYFVTITMGSGVTADSFNFQSVTGGS